MGPSENRVQTLSAEAGADVSALAYCGVKMNSSEQMIVCSSTGELCMGVLTADAAEATAAGMPLTFIPFNSGGTGKIKVGAAVAVGDELHVQATTGKFIKASPAAGQYVHALARQAGSGDGSIIEAYFVCYRRTS